MLIFFFMNQKTENFVFKRVRDSRELLNENEVAFYFHNDEIYTPNFESLEKVLNGFGLKFFSLKAERREKEAKNAKYVNLFKDNYGNYLVLESKRDEMKLELIPGIEIRISGVLTNRYAFLYEQNRERRIDLTQYMKFYPRNDFDKFLIRVLDSFDRRIEYVV